MRRIDHRVKRAICAAVVAATVALGPAEALARSANTCTGADRCSPSNCTVSCQRRGHAGGDCFNGVCVCWST